MIISMYLLILYPLVTQAFVPGLSGPDKGVLWCWELFTPQNNVDICLISTHELNPGYLEMIGATFQGSTPNIEAGSRSEKALPEWVSYSNFNVIYNFFNSFGTFIVRDPSHEHGLIE